jgi:UDP-N-acetylmuramyl pentapeptide phosphotransferase/UDP-N-acetylglucosamine-1-phosphate transferase
MLAIGWMTNLYNFMDGADGLAAGMAVVGFGTYALGAWTAGDTGFVLVNLSVAGAAAAFLVVNFPPARMFMGDAGSIPLGFLAAVLGLTGWELGLWPLWFPPVVFAPFVLDASVTLVRRALRGEKLWQAHRSHYYQRQVLLGWSHRQLAMFEYGLMMATALAALIAQRAEPLTQATILGALAVAYMGIGLSVDLHWRKRQDT